MSKKPTSKPKSTKMKPAAESSGTKPPAKGAKKPGAKRAAA